MSSQPHQPDQPSPSFDLAALDAAIAATEFSGYTMHLSTATSTNDLAYQAAQVGARHGVWIADRQTAGRGRGGHTWHSAPGEGLYMSALISPPIPIEFALRLSLATAIAAQSAIVSVFGFQRRDQIDIRWPNDLMLNGRKVGGILIDTASNPPVPPSPAMLRYAVAGIGINLNHAVFPPELEAIATSIRRELDASGYPKASALGLPDPEGDLGFSPWGGSSPAACFRREPLAAAILVALDAEVRLLIRGWRGTNNRPDRNLADCSSWITGKRVRVEANDDDPGYTGVTAGLDPQGFLLVAGDDGQLHTVLSGGLREP